MADWNAETYHRVSNPQFEWGLPVLARLPLRGDELVLDVGCGTGRLTEKLLDRLPRGRVIGIDASAAMLRVAADDLRPRFASRFHGVRADAAALPIHLRADAVFSTATFHWVRDHAQLFRSLFDALTPGGRLVAQCGGGPNIARIHARADAVMRCPEFAVYFGEWNEPWEFADADATAKRLTAAGFVDVRTSIEAAPVVQPDASAFHVFLSTVICRPYLGYLPDEPLRRSFVDRLTEQAAGDAPAFELDYWRLNIDARKPA